MHGMCGMVCVLVCMCVMYVRNSHVCIFAWYVCMSVMYAYVYGIYVMYACRHVGMCGMYV